MLYRDNEIMILTRPQRFLTPQEIDELAKSKPGGGRESPFFHHP